MGFNVVFKVLMYYNVAGSTIIAEKWYGICPMAQEKFARSEILIANLLKLLASWDTTLYLGQLFSTFRRIVVL